MSRHKRQNQTMCDAQNGACALCKQPIPTGPNQMCYYEPKNAVVCRTCNTILHNYVRLKEPGGVTISDLEAFLTQDPATTPRTAPRGKRLSPGRLHDLQTVIDWEKRGGSMTVTEWCQRVGISEEEAMRQLADQ